MIQEDYEDLITVPRNAWDPTEGVHPRHGERSFPMIQMLEVHWPAAFNLDDHGDSQEELDAYEAFHEVSKGWTDLFYHCVADSEGDIYAGRDPLVWSQNDLKGVLTFLVNHGINDDLTPVERDIYGFSIWKAWNAVDPGRSPNSIRWHGERATTECPGEHVRGIVTDLRNGWLPPQVGRPHDMYIEHHTDTDEFFVVRPSGRAKVSEPTHWRQVIMAGAATGVYKSDFFQELDNITKPYQVAQSGAVMVTELEDSEIDRIANRVLDLQAERLES